MPFINIKRVQKCLFASVLILDILNGMLVKFFYSNKLYFIKNEKRKKTEVVLNETYI